VGLKRKIQTKIIKGSGFFCRLTREKILSQKLDTRRRYNACPINQTSVVKEQVSSDLCGYYSKEK
jgi:hypothetical protein